MTAIPVSIVVVSRGRPDALLRCLTSLSQLFYPKFEVIVVADPAGIEAIQTLPFLGTLKQVPFDEQNISAARNLGVEASGGDVVAFIDDDAVAEPTWLTHLIDPFSKADIACSGGFVIGRNGISMQWTAQSVDQTGQTAPLEVHATNPTVLQASRGKAIKTEGTNMAIRRDVLIELGGFDTAFKYFLDETDLNLRLADAGLFTAIVPLAQVHHGYLGNSSRNANRAPTDLSEIGASWAVFLRKHTPTKMRETVWKTVRKNQRLRCLEHMVKGTLEPRDIHRLTTGLQTGYVEGLTRAIQTQPNLATDSPFHAFQYKRPHQPKVLAGWVFAKARLTEQAEAGDSIFLFSPTSLFHRVRFTRSGLWIQRGGLFGKSDRSDPVFQLTTRKKRVAREIRRVQKIRGIQA